MEIVKVEVYISIADLGKPWSDERGMRLIVCLLRSKKNRLKATSNGVKVKYETQH